MYLYRNNNDRKAPGNAEETGFTDTKNSTRTTLDSTMLGRYCLPINFHVAAIEIVRGNEAIHYSKAMAATRREQQESMHESRRRHPASSFSCSILWRRHTLRSDKKET